MIVWHQSPAFDVSCANENWHVTIMYVVWKVKEDGHLLAYQQRGALIWRVISYMRMAGLPWDTMMDSWRCGKRRQIDH